MKRSALTVLVAALAASLVPTAAAAVVRGTVVKHDARLGGAVVAGNGGQLRFVQGPGAVNLKVGQVVRASGSMRSGNLRAAAVRVVGRTGSAEVSGVIVRHTTGHYVLAANGAVLVVHSSARHASGQRVSARVGFSSDGLDEHGCHVDDNHAGETELRGTIAAVGGGTLTINLREDGSVVVVQVGSVDVSQIAVGDEVEADVTVTQDSSGTTSYTLQSIHREDAGDHGDEVEVRGSVSALTATLVTIALGTQSLVFAIPAGFDLHGVAVGDTVEARGDVVAGTLTLTRIGADDNGNGDDNGGHGGGDGGHGGGGDGGGSGGHH